MSGTESDNHAIFGISFRNNAAGASKHIITTQ